jgi:hypothetical protein
MGGFTLSILGHELSRNFGRHFGLLGDSEIGGEDLQSNPLHPHIKCHPKDLVVS